MMKYDQAVKRLLRLENNLESFKKDVVDRYSELLDKYDKIDVRQKQEAQFRSETRKRLSEIENQINLAEEDIDDLEKFIEAFSKAITASKKLKKLFNLEQNDEPFYSKRNKVRLSDS